MLVSLEDPFNGGHGGVVDVDLGWERGRLHEASQLGQVLRDDSARVLEHALRYTVCGVPQRIYTHIGVFVAGVVLHDLGSRFPRFVPLFVLSH